LKEKRGMLQKVNLRCSNQKFLLIAMLYTVASGDCYAIIGV